MIFADKHNPFDVGERRAMWFTRKAIQFAVAACECSVLYHLMRGFTHARPASSLKQWTND